TPTGISTARSAYSPNPLERSASVSRLAVSALRTAARVWLAARARAALARLPLAWPTLRAGLRARVVEPARRVVAFLREVVFAPVLGLRAELVAGGMEPG